MREKQVGPVRPEVEAAIFDRYYGLLPSNVIKLNVVYLFSSPLHTGVEICEEKHVAVARSTVEGLP